MPSEFDSRFTIGNPNRDETVSFSVVINTDARLDHLQRTLAALKQLKYSLFEVCVVAGPTPDGTREFLASLSDRIKVAHCDERNLSKSRNIGIALAAGDVVAFIDDDGIPEPEWLNDLAESYRDDRVGAVGGLVYDHTGVNFQARFVTVNRLGYPAHWSAAAPHLNFPFSPDVPHLLGTNCSFRRSALLEVGGFDEEYEYFLDETDVAMRINDAGYVIVQRADAFVHHKYAPSHLRDEKRIIRNWYPLLKNRVYFGLRNGIDHHSETEVLDAGLSDARNWEKAVLEAASQGIYTDDEVERFYDEAATALKDGHSRAVQPQKLLTPATLEKHRQPFLAHPTLLPEQQRRTICLVTQDYPPGQNGGIARYFAQLARSLADAGHHVHVLTKAKEAATVDYEGGVWVHRVEIVDHPLPSISPISPLVVPGHIWSYSQTMLREVEAIDCKRNVDLVYCPLWDCEPIAFVLDQKFRLMVALQTTMKFWLESQKKRANDAVWMRTFGHPIVAMERLILERAEHFHAISHAIARDIRQSYGVELARSKMLYAHLCMEDWAREASSSSSGSKKTRLLFVGRLESRKGIDVLLRIAPKILSRFPDVVLDIVGDDTIQKPEGGSYKDEFLALDLPRAVRRRIIFHGRVEEEQLREFYRSCDVFVAPSRYESFGLIFLEALVFGKPVIGCAAGGCPEVIKDGETGFLVKPGDGPALERALEKLISDRALRAKMGKAARNDYEKRFTEGVLARKFELELERLDRITLANVRKALSGSKLRMIA